jgi:hypothetical protein
MSNATPGFEGGGGVLEAPSGYEEVVARVVPGIVGVRDAERLVPVL